MASVTARPQPTDHAAEVRGPARCFTTLGAQQQRTDHVAGDCKPARSSTEMVARPQPTATATGVRRAVMGVVPVSDKGGHNTRSPNPRTPLEKDGRRGSS